MTLPAAPKLPNWISQLKGWAKGKLLLRFRIQNGSVKLQIKFHGWPLSGWRYIRQASGVGCSQCSCKQALQLSPFRYGPVGGRGATIRRLMDVFLLKPVLRGFTYTPIWTKSLDSHMGYRLLLQKLRRLLRGYKTSFSHVFSLQIRLSAYLCTCLYRNTYEHMCICVCLSVCTHLHLSLHVCICFIGISQFLFIIVILIVVISHHEAGRSNSLSLTGGERMAFS